MAVWGYTWQHTLIASLNGDLLGEICLQCLHAFINSLAWFGWGINHTYMLGWMLCGVDCCDVFFVLMFSLLIWRWDDIHMIPKISPSSSGHVSHCVINIDSHMLADVNPLSAVCAKFMLLWQRQMMAKVAKCRHFRNVKVNWQNVVISGEKVTKNNRKIPPTLQDFAFARRLPEICCKNPFLQVNPDQCSSWVILATLEMALEVADLSTLLFKPIYASGTQHELTNIKLTFDWSCDLGCIKSKLVTTQDQRLWPKFIASKDSVRSSLPQKTSLKKSLWLRRMSQQTLFVDPCWLHRASPAGTAVQMQWMTAAVSTAYWVAEGAPPLPTPPGIQQACDPCFLSSVHRYMSWTQALLHLARRSAGAVRGWQCVSECERCDSLWTEQTKLCGLQTRYGLHHTQAWHVGHLCNM